ncbi:MAG: WYL domain-containing protein [Planctomycetota bacterium]|nr:MAG: WYL domain-containing protein [Planctomycetota bacterium]
MSRLNYARIVYRLLTSPRGWRVDELQRELNIAPRTWTKYRKVLEEEFEPFFARGETRLRVVQEPDGRYLRLVDPDQASEGTRLLSRLASFRLAELLVGALGQPFGNAVADAFAALGSGRRTDSQRRLLARLHEHFGRMLYVRHHARKDYREHGETIDRLLEALVRQRQVRIAYCAANAPHGSGPREHVLEPLTLTLYLGGLYLLARYPGDRRVYNFVVDRIESIDLLPDGFAYPSAEEYDPGRVLERSFGIFFRADGGRERNVVLVFANKPWLQQYLLERRWHPQQRFKRLRDGRLRMTLRVANTVELAQWVRGFGDDVRVVRPKNLLSQ